MRETVSSQSEPDFAGRFGEIPDPLAPRGTPPVSRPPVLDEAPQRTLTRQRRLLALTGSIAWLAAHLVVYGIRSDLGELSVPYLAAQIFLPFLVASGSLAVALGPGKLGLGLKITLIAALAVLGPITFCLIALGAPVPRAVSDGGALLPIFVCFDITVAWAAVPLLLAALSLRGAFAAGARWRSALVGAGVGLAAGATMNVHCPNVAPAHMLFGHGLPVLVATLLGAAFLTYRSRA
jgi:hypothetical protein